MPETALAATTDHPALIRLSKAEQALASAKDLSDFKKIMDVAAAARTYARAAKLGEDTVRHAEEINLKAQRGAGEFLKKLERGKRGGDNKSAKAKDQTSHAANFDSPYRVAITTAGIGKDAASRYQQVAAVPEPKFNAYLKEVREAKTDATTAGLLREAKQDAKSQKKDDKATTEKPKWDFALGSDRLRKAVDREIALAGEKELPRIVYALRMIIKEVGGRDL